MNLNYRLKVVQQSNGHIPFVVLLHGLFGNLSNLDTIAHHLNKHYHILQIDLRNHGLSPHTSSMSYNEMAQDVLTLLDKLLIKRCIVIGHSMGGKVLMTLCNKASELIKVAVVIEMAPIRYEKNHYIDTIFTALMHINDMRPMKRNEGEQLMMKDIRDHHIIQFLLKSLHNGYWRFNFHSIKNNYAKILDWQTQPPWPGPILFIRGNNSSYLNYRYRTKLCQQFPHSHGHVVANAGHWVHTEKPKEVLRAIFRFLREHLTNKIVQISLYLLLWY